MQGRIVIAALAGGALFFAGFNTHIFGKGYFLTSVLGGISFGILLFFKALLDKNAASPRKVT